MFGLGPFEIGIVCMVGLLLFGARLPSAARSVGEAFRVFRDEVKEVQK